MPEYKNVEEVIDSIVADMQEYFAIILRHVRDPGFFNDKDENHCAAWTAIRQLRDRAFALKELMKGSSP